MKNAIVVGAGIAPNAVKALNHLGLGADLRERDRRQEGWRSACGPAGASPSFPQPMSSCVPAPRSTAMTGRDETAGTTAHRYHHTRTVEIAGRTVRAHVERDFYLNQEPRLISG